VQWISPGAALDAGRASQIELWFPTAMTLAELADHEDIGSVLAAQRQVDPRLPELSVEDGVAWLSAPGDKEYPL